MHVLERKSLPRVEFDLSSYLERRKKLLNLLGVMRRPKLNFFFYLILSLFPIYTVRVDNVPNGETDLQKFK
jgi:hypothetical protein